MAITAFVLNIEGFVPVQRTFVLVPDIRVTFKAEFRGVAPQEVVVAAAVGIVASSAVPFSDRRVHVWRILDILREVGMAVKAKVVDRHAKKPPTLRVMGLMTQGAATVGHRTMHIVTGEGVPVVAAKAELGTISSQGEIGALP